MVLASCNCGADEKGSEPAIIFAEGNVTENTLTFDVTVNDAVAHSYSYSSSLSGARKYFTGGTVKVEDAGNSKHKITVKMAREDEKVYDFTWTGTAQEKL